MSSRQNTIVTTQIAHGLTNGTKVRVSRVGTANPLNGNRYFIRVLDDFRFELYTDSSLTTAVGTDKFNASGIAFVTPYDVTSLNYTFTPPTQEVAISWINNNGNTVGWTNNYSTNPYTLEYQPVTWIFSL